MKKLNPFDVIDRLHDIEPSEELMEAERELQEDSDHSMQMLVLAILLSLIVLAIVAGWLL